MKSPFPPVAAILALACSAAAAQDLARHASVYRGSQGLEAVVAPTADDKNALVRLSGINHAVDGVVFLADTSVQGDSTYYQVPIDGRVRNLVFTRVDQRWGSAHGETFAGIPDLRDPVPVSYDERASKALDRDALLAAYRKQKAGKVQEKLGALDRPRAVARAEATVAENDAHTAKVCGVPVRTTIDWASISDDMITRLGIASFCGAPSDALRLNCESEPAIKADAARFATIRCAFGDKLRLQLQDGTLLFTTQEHAANQVDFATQFLRNQ